MNKFPDGSIQQYAANIITENIYSQVDKDGHKHKLMEGIIDHVSDETAISKTDGFTTNHNGLKRRKITTKG